MWVESRYYTLCSCREGPFCPGFKFFSGLQSAFTAKSAHSPPDQQEKLMFFQPPQRPLFLTSRLGTPSATAHSSVNLFYTPCSVSGQVMYRCFY